MAAVTVAPTEDDVMTDVRKFLLSFLPDGTEVIQGQPNRVAEPNSPNFVVMTPTGQRRLSTNVDTQLDGFNKQITMDSEIAIQLDIHGPQSSDLTHTINLLWRDDYGVTNTDSGIIVPLYVDEPHQAPFLNAEKQYETRWVMTVYLQANPVVVVPQDSATQLIPTLYEADK